MKKRFYWSYRRFGTAPKYEFWLRNMNFGSEGKMMQIAVWQPFVRPVRHTDFLAVQNLMHGTFLSKLGLQRR